MQIPAFWDGSALAPVCVGEGATVSGDLLVQSFTAPEVWWGTAVEIASALARLVRRKQLDPAKWARARQLAEKHADSWSVIQPSDAVRMSSLELVERYDPRAADSFQLAALLQWCGEVPQEHIFLTADRRLREAAQSRGFEVKEI